MHLIELSIYTFIVEQRSAKRAKEQGQYLSPTEEPLKIFWRIDSSQRRLSGGGQCVGSTKDINVGIFVVVKIVF